MIQFNKDSLRVDFTLVLSTRIENFGAPNQNTLNTHGSVNVHCKCICMIGSGILHRQAVIVVNQLLKWNSQYSYYDKPWSSLDKGESMACQITSPIQQKDRLFFIKAIF